MNTRLEHKIFNEFYIKLLMIVVTLLYCVPFLMVWMDELVNVILGYSAVFVLYDIIRRRDIVKTKHIAFAILYLFSFCVTVYVHSFQSVDIKIAIYLFMQLMLFTYCAAYKSKDDMKKEMHLLFRIIICIGFVYSVASLGMYFISFYKVYTNDVMDMALIIGKHPNSSLYGIMGNSNWMSFFMLTCTALTLCEMKYSMKWKKFDVLVMVLSIFTLFLTNSRGGFIGFMAFCCLYLLYSNYTNINKRKIKYLTIPIFAILLFISNKYIVLMGDSISNAIGNVIYDSETIQKTQSSKGGRNDQEQSESTSIRFELWKTGANVIRDNPLFGVGNAELPKQMYMHRTSENKLAINTKVLSANSHNIYIQVLLMSGFIGMLLWLSYILTNLFYIFIHFLKNKWSREDQQIIGILGSLILSYMVINLVEADIFISRNFMSTLFWVIFGYLICMTQLANGEDRHYSGLYRIVSRKKK